MSRTIPYLQRRGDAFNFRIAVPADLRLLLRRRELTKALDTRDLYIAGPRSLRLAAEAKQLFYDLRVMIKKNKPDLGEIRIDYNIKVGFDENNKRYAVVEAQPEETNQAMAAMSQAVEAMNRLKPPTFSVLSRPEPTVEAATLTLVEATKQFLDEYPKSKAAMLKKHNACIPAFCEVVGDMPLVKLKRSHVKEFFEILQKLPPRWSDIKRKERLTIRQIAGRTFDKLINEKTFKFTYKTSISQFLSWARENFGEEGFAEISINKIEYSGTRKAGEDKQRAFLPHELKRLFEGVEMAGFAADQSLAHFYWLPMLGLYTGARVNEICQLNPQHDILQDPSCGIWYVRITEETAGDVRIRKSVKNVPSERKVPIHSKLIECGFLEYFERVRASGAALMFPPWKPSRGRASSEAEKWFRKHLAACGLRDKTVGAQLVGMHAFRHTLSNAAMNAGVNEDTIVGHSGGASAVAQGYRGELSMPNKQAIIEKITYDILHPVATC